LRIPAAAAAVITTVDYNLRWPWHH
jgi:hypothetical protein